MNLSKEDLIELQAIGVKIGECSQKLAQVVISFRPLESYTALLCVLIGVNERLGMDREELIKKIRTTYDKFEETNNEKS